MARNARQQSESRIYHVMLRGINQTQLFYDSDDRQAFLKRLERFKEEGSYQLYAYALLGNHVHLLMKEGTAPLAQTIKKLSVSYSYYFNARYDRSGYLFQGRFKSEPVDDDAYLLTVFKYIHHNPVRIGERIDSWTSYNDYLKTPVLADTDFMLGMFSDDKDQARRQLAEFLDVPLPEETDFFGLSKPKSINDVKAMEKIRQVGAVDSSSALAELDRADRDQILARLKAEGLTIRQLSRLTGINRGIVQKAK